MTKIMSSSPAQADQHGPDLFSTSQVMRLTFHGAGRNSGRPEFFLRCK